MLRNTSLGGVPARPWPFTKWLAPAILAASFACTLPAQLAPGQLAPGQPPPAQFPPFQVPQAIPPNPLILQNPLMVVPGQPGGPLRPPPPGSVIVQEIFRCHHVKATSMLVTLSAIFPPDQLRIVLGPDAFSPRLESGSFASTGSEVKAMASLASIEVGLGAHDLVLLGDETTVARAVALAAELDHHRAQVRLKIKITDISFDALRELGVKYNWSSYASRELPRRTTVAGTPDPGNVIPSIDFARFGHLPISLDATIAALETQNKAKLLAEPSISMLDGERGFILIGDRILYPKLTGYTQAQTPIYDKEEVRVGIYVQVAVQMSEHGDLTLSVYPQVSTITGYLNVGGASYPQISTREEQTTVRLRDGETLVLGGLLRDEEIAALQRVPLLGRIPILGELLTNRKKTKSRNDLVIMITPEVIADPEESGVSGGHSHDSPAPPAAPVAPKPQTPQTPQTPQKP